MMDEDKHKKVRVTPYTLRKGDANSRGVYKQLIYDQIAMLEKLLILAEDEQHNTGDGQCSEYTILSDEDVVHEE